MTFNTINLSFFLSFYLLPFYSLFLLLFWIPFFMNIYSHNLLALIFTLFSQNLSCNFLLQYLPLKRYFFHIHPFFNLAIIYCLFPTFALFLYLLIVGYFIFDHILLISPLFPSFSFLLNSFKRNLNPRMLLFFLWQLWGFLFRSLSFVFRTFFLFSDWPLTLLRWFFSSEFNLQC